MGKKHKKRNPSSWWAMPVGMGLGLGWLGLAGYTIYSNARAIMSGETDGHQDSNGSE